MVSAGNSTFRDRTSEFRSLSDTLKKFGRISAANPDRSNQQNDPSTSSKLPVTPSSYRSEFNKKASRIGLGIHETSKKISRLANLAKKSSIFDDPLKEIQELTALIKNDITTLNVAVSDLQTLQNMEIAEGDYSEDTVVHSTAVCDDLKNKLMGATKKFQDVLTTRTENIKAHENRRQIFSTSIARENPLRQQPKSVMEPPPWSTPSGQPSESSVNGVQVGNQLRRRLAVESSTPSQNMNSGASMLQQQVVPQQESYTQNRAVALQSVESTITELSGIFTNLATMVAHQGELAIRIDDNMEESLSNVEGARGALLKHLNRISSNSNFNVARFHMSFAASMTTPACFRGNIVPLSQCSSCCDIRFQPFISSYINHGIRRNIYPVKCVSRLVVSGNRVVKCRASETETGPDADDDKEKEAHEAAETAEPLISSGSDIGDDKGKDKGQPSQLEALNKFLDSTKAQGVTEDKGQPTQLDMLNKLLNKDDVEAKPKEVAEGQLAQLESLNNILNTNDTESKTTGLSEDADKIEVTSGSPLPGVKPQRLDELFMIPKETIDILKDQVFGFDTFFVTSQEPYEAGVLFKGNLRGQAAVTYKKIEKRLHETFGDQYKLFLLINPEDDKPVAVIVPRKTLQPETTAVPEWFAAGSFGIVTIFTLLLRNVPALQSNLLSVFDNTEVLKEGVSGALVTALILGVHEISHILVAKEAGVKLGVPFFVPSWQIGSFGGITRILNIVPKREDLLKIAAAGPLAGFSLGLLLLLFGFFLPPADGIGVIVDASVFHESLLAGGIAKLVLGDVLKEGATIAVNPLVIWAWAGLLINAINSIPAGELDGGRISFAIWGRKAASRFTAASIVLLGLSSLLDDVAFYWVVLIFFLQRGPIAPLAEEISEPDNKYVALGITVLVFEFTCLFALSFSIH
ncbi:unnamed protein product [Lactuca saligna]|uniref:t-SNARE coiled-coil homology domain-containing protein n=1 Tax=Lactuca saligna TaxID=75948 RepID=A0AA35ZPG1_LACSI|nr:unnamed protein product [Lactuca saligna]